ncbi:MULTISPECIES: tol-pal system YbgF family protein [unclassified Streptomyces]|uniref:tetratricopeptide repeat protein n=1 Tax=unclassified Streptomyces TaxID=2593676 RepID=UPI00093F097D|nr:hypothetical protein [Streptomyces sp. TSRI0281]OKI40546.1 hypothetical protein A6A29_39200 [Streptomyces sp. TSRI0281]
MPRGVANEKLAVLLEATSWSAADLARAVNALGEARGLRLRYDRTSVAHWLRGSRPRGPVPDLVAQALSLRAGRLISAEDAGLTHPDRLPGSGRLPPGTGREGGGGLPVLIALCGQDADPNQRAALVGISYLLVPPPVWRPDPFHPGPGGELHASADQEFLNTMVQLFAGLVSAHGGAYIRSALAAYLADNAARLTSVPAGENVNPHILNHCARLVHLLAFMTADSGHHGLADRYYRLALELAREAGNRAAYAITLRAMSVQALGLGHIHQAHCLADSAVECAGRNDPAVLAFVLAQRGHTHAARHNGKGAMADLVDSADAHGRADGHGGAFTAYPEAGIEYRRARTLQVLQRPGEAVLAFQSSVLHRDPGQHRPYALTQARLAEALVADGQLEAACTHWHIFLDHYPHVVGSNEVGRALARMLQHMRSFPRQRQAVELIERGRASSARLPRY